MASNSFDYHRPDALTPAEITEKVLSLSVTKTSIPFAKQWPLTFLAGVYIALGGLFCTLFSSDAALPYAIQKFLGGAVFSLGLSLVVVAGAELYTGNTMIAAGAVDGRIRWQAVLKNWVFVWLGNAAGAVTVALLVYGSHIAETGPLARGMYGIALAKVSADWNVIFVKGILCNLLVCLGVWVAYAGRTVIDRVAGVMLPVAAFVALGFEHCIANLYFLPLAMMLKAGGLAVEGLDLGLLTWGAVAKNLTAATLGNTLAGVVLALLYRAAYARKSAD